MVGSWARSASSPGSAALKAGCTARMLAGTSIPAPTTFAQPSSNTIGTTAG